MMQVTTQYIMHCDVDPAAVTCDVLIHTSLYYVREYITHEYHYPFLLSHAKCTQMGRIVTTEFISPFVYQNS